jgi:hypothetical protein
MFRCMLHSPDGDDLGESTYAVLLTPGEEILLGRRCSGCCRSGALAERGCAGKAKRGRGVTTVETVEESETGVRRAIGGGPLGEVLRWVHDA